MPDCSYTLDAPSILLQRVARYPLLIDNFLWLTTTKYIKTNVSDYLCVLTLIGSSKYLEGSNEIHKKLGWKVLI